ncbi:Neurofibromin 1 [Irineochytrium annulatum]|nr:Neurofibromin 1 [Irineochytrium annulatum]
MQVPPNPHDPTQGGSPYQPAFLAHPYSPQQQQAQLHRDLSATSSASAATSSSNSPSGAPSGTPSSASTPMPISIAPIASLAGGNGNGAGNGGNGGHSLMPPASASPSFGVHVSVSTNQAIALADSRVLQSLIMRIVDKLPIKSGIPLSLLEQDDGMNQSVISLITLAQWRLGDIMVMLLKALDSIANSAMQKQQMSQEDPYASVDIVQSQLFVLRLMATCMALHWKRQRDSLSPFGERAAKRRIPSVLGSSGGGAGANSNISHAPVTLSPRPVKAQSSFDLTSLRGSSASPALEGRNALGTPPQPNASAITAASLMGVSSGPQPIFMDPPALEEHLAKQVLTAVSRYFFTSSAAINADTISHSFLSEFTSLNPLGLATPNSNIAAFFMTEEATKERLFATPVASPDYMVELQRAAGRVLFFLSSSNWFIVFNRIKAKLQMLGQRGGDENALDLTELRFIEWSNFDRSRLTLMLSEVNPAIKTYPKNAQFLLAIVLRRGIWNWIETHPLEFGVLYSSQKRLEGGPDSLFDNLTSISEMSSRKKAIFWPTQMMLLILCPDILHAMTSKNDKEVSPAGTKMIVPTNVVSKKQSWLDSVRRGLKQKRGEVALLCLVDVCKASTFLNKVDGSPLRFLVPNIEAEVKEKLFAPILSMNYSIDDIEIDMKMSTDCATALYRLNAWNQLKTLNVGLTDPAAPLIYKAILIRGCLDIVSEENALPWNPMIDASLAAPIRQLFSASIVRGDPRVETVKRNLRKAITIVDEGMDKIEIKDASIIGMEELRSVVNGICSAVVDPNESIRTHAAECIRALMNADAIPYWDGTTPDWASPVPGRPSESSMYVFLRTSSQILVMLSRSLVNQEQIQEGANAPVSQRVKMTLCLLRDLLQMRNAYLSARRAVAAVGITSAERSAATASMEVSLLVLLCSADTEITTMAISCIGYLIDEADLVGETSLAAAMPAAHPDLEYESDPNAEIITVQSPTVGHGTLVNPVAGTNSPLNFPGGANGVVQAATSPAMTPVSAPSALHFHNPLLQLEGGLLPQPSSIIENLAVYRELRTLYVQGSVVTGQKALQKRIRKVLRKSERPTAGNMGAWEQIYKRWRSLSTALGTKNGVVSGLGGSAVVAETFEDKGDWQNYTGFLCALGGVCLQASDIFDEQVRKETQQLGIRDENFSMDELDNYASGAGHLGSYANVRAIVEKFITELINLLVCDNVVVREAVKEFLGNELNHRLFDALLAHYENIVTRFLTTPEQVSVDRNILFVESAISVLKMILERTADPTDQSSMLMELPGDVDVGSLVISFFKFLNRLSLFYAVPPHIAMRIKVKMCQLVEVVIAKREFIALRQDIRVRNMLMEALLDWNSGVQELEVYKDPDAKNHKLFMDLDLGSMKAMVAVLNGLPLQPSSEMITTVSLNAQQTSATVTEDFDGYDAAKEAKDRLFRKYLEFFLRALEKFKALEEHFFAKQELATRTNSVAGTSLAGSASSEPSLVMSSKAKEALVYLNNLKDYTILALSNLLAANIDIGLKFSLSMGYHYDLKMRAAFMQVLVNLLDSGAAEQFASLGEEGVVLRARYEKMLEMVVSHDLSVVLALAEADTEDVAGTLLAVFEAKGQSERLITALLEQEVARTEYAYDLLRRNSVTSRLLTHLARSRGRDYIVDTLRPVIQELLAFNPTLTFEIDPVKMTERDDATINMRNLKMLIRKLLDSITNHTDRFPDSLRSVCHSISTIAGRKFPEARVTSIGAFVFLRFICPAIVAPESHDVVPMFSSKDIRRGLVLAAKVVQNLANNVLFGTKEKFMEDLNDSLRKNIGRVHAFLRNISTLPELPTGSPLHIEINATGANSGADVSEYDLMRLHRLLALNLDRIEASNEFAIGVPGRSDENTALRKRRFRELSTLIAQLGPAPEMARLRQALISKESHGKGRRMSWLFTSSATDSAQALTEFMTRVQQRSGSDKALEVLRERNIFFASGRSKDRIPVLYFIARKVQPDSIDMDLVLFHMLTVAQAMGNQPFDLVVDVTHFNVENQWDLEYISKLNELIPTAFKTNLKTLIVYSCNSIFLKYFTTFLGVTEISVQAKILFVSTITEILNHIPSTDLALPESTLAVERDVTAVFSPVNRITENRQQMPVILKVGPESLHLTWVDRFEILGSNACITDIFRFSEVEEVISVGEDGEFLIKHIDRSNGSSFLGVSGGGAVSSTLSTMVFRSPKRDGIITAVRMAKSRFRKSRPQNVVSDSKNLRAADVPGTLLNMAMLNLGTMDPYLRLMSYNLLDSVGRGFSFDIGNQLLSAKGV